MPGITTKSGMNSLMKPAKSIPFCASRTDLAANARWMIYWLHPQ